MEETTNYSLKLIEDTDDYTDIFDDHNDSMEIIDRELAKKLESVPVMTGAASSTAGSAGLVPAPSAGDQDKVLKGNGTWETIPTMTGAASSAAGSAGLVPAPSSGDQDKVLKGNGTWEAIPTMTGATALTDGTAGMVPAPVAGETGRFLRADGTWTVPAGSGDSQVGIYAIDATIPVSAWVAGTNDYSVVISDQTVVSTMTVLEWGITNETESNPLMLGETDVTVGAGTVTITTDVIPEASWTVHIDLGTDGSNVLEEVAGKADQELLGYREDGNTASRTIEDGSFVVWKGSLYKANGSIPQGTAFSSSNLTEVTDGGLNELQSDVESLNDSIGSLFVNLTGTISANKNAQIQYPQGYGYNNTIIVTTWLTKWGHTYFNVDAIVGGNTAPAYIEVSTSRDDCTGDPCGVVIIKKPN